MKLGTIWAGQYNARLSLLTGKISIHCFN